VVAGVLKTVLKTLDDAKAEDIVSINIENKSALADYLVVASGRSHRHVGAIADQLLKQLKGSPTGNPKVEGRQNSDWILIDIGDIIVHVFRPEVREFYGLERMWQVPDAPAQN